MKTITLLLLLIFPANNLDDSWNSNFVDLSWGYNSNCYGAILDKEKTQ